MAYTSFPIEEQPLSGAQWGQVMRGTGTGVIDYGGHPFRMKAVTTADDQSNTITLMVESGTGRAEAVMNGFFFRADSDITLTVPAVTSGTDYTIVLQFDPLRHTDPLGPIRPMVVAGGFDRTQGKTYLALYRGRREPSSVLSSVQWKAVRPRVSPAILIDHPDDLPHPNADGYLYGTLARLNNSTREWQLRGSYGALEWKDVSNPPWQDLWLPTARKWAGWGFEPQMKVFPGYILVRGVFRRSDDSPFTAGGSWTLASLPGISGLPGVLRWGGATGLNGGTILVDTNGEIKAEVARDTTTIGIDSLIVYTS